MEIDEFLDLLKKRRSIRRFRPDPVPDEYVEKILEAGRWAMSGANGQPWEFIVVRDPETKKKIAELHHWHQEQAHVIENTRAKEFRHPAHIEGLPPARFTDAPVLIVVLGDRRTFQATVLATHFLGGEGGPMGNYLKNVGNATQNLQLAAAALGLGAAWVSVSGLVEGPLKTLLDVPEELQVHTIVPIGYPAHKPGPGYRRKLEEITHHDKYDRSKYRSAQDVVDFVRLLRQRTKSGYPD